MSGPYLAIVNPTAGGGRCRKLLGPALERLRAAGLHIDLAETTAPTEATQIAREAYAQGRRRFLAVGGDGTSYEIVNGLFPEAQATEPPVLGFLPLGTGNSFLRDFGHQDIEAAIQALIAGRTRPSDVIRLQHKHGTVYYINLLSLGFAADVNFMRARRFNHYGQLGYVLSIFTCLARLDRRPFPLSIDGQGNFDDRRCLFLSFNNSKFTGGTMMIAPDADVNDGLIEYVRWGPIGRLGLIRNLYTLYDGTHIKHPLASRRGAKQIDFRLDHAVRVMIDGEALTLHCERLDVLPSALSVVV
ncbi:MAG TPA: diacylglycerol kinase family protein [Terriglobales bacterium]|nr:diacylglycerol kinase family protein [Terriglobales bacterium]